MKREPIIPGVRLFLGFQLVCWLAFLCLDISGEIGTPSDKALACSGGIKYLTIFVCYCWRQGKKDRKLEQAQHLVLFADFFLLFTRHVNAGIFCFLGVHGCYRKYLETSRKSRRRIICRDVFLWVSLGAVVLVAEIWESIRDMGTLTLATMYTGIAIRNLSLAWKKERNGLFFRALLLLLLCDVNLVIYNLSGYEQGWAGVAIWLFYLPSQVLVTLTAILEQEKTG